MNTKKLIMILLTTLALLAVVGGGCTNSGPAVKNGDTVNIDFVGTLDGVAFAGGTAYGYDLVIGSGRFIDGFESQIIGMKVGEVRDINVTFPQNYSNAALRGKPVVFRITLNSINGK